MTSNHSTKETITLDTGGLGSQDKNHLKSLVCVNLTSVNFNQLFCNVDVLAPKKYVGRTFFWSPNARGKKKDRRPVELCKEGVATDVILRSAATQWSRNGR